MVDGEHKGKMYVDMVVESIRDCFLKDPLILN